MIKPIVCLALAVATLPASARTLNVVCSNVTYAFPAEEMGVVTYNSGDGFSFMGRHISSDEITRMFVDDSTVEPNTVTVTYNSEGANAVVAGNIAAVVDVSFAGAHVTVTQSDLVDTTVGEITYRLSGASNNGAFVLIGSYKSTIELLGIDLTSLEGAAMDIQNGKRIAVSAKNGTINSLTDGPTGNHKAALYCKGHLELKGKGELNVTGRTAHAVSAKEYIELKNCTLNILGAKKDGINCTQYFAMESGSITIAGIEGDGIQTDFKDTTDREPEDTGSINITGGTIKIDVTATACKGLKAEGDVTVSGGTLEITTSAKGQWDSSKAKTKASAGIGADANVTIDGGKLTISASGSGGKGISCDGSLTINAGEINVTTTGGVFAYVNGTEYDGYTGNLDNLASDAKSSPKGMKADGAIEINGGQITVNTTGYGAEGIESKSTLTVNDGSIFVKAYDDAINSSSHMYIKGGTVTVISTKNDGLDSNGNLYIMGGKTMALGGSSPECGIDANTEQGYKVYFTGGSLLAVGGSNSVPSNSESTQAYVTGTGTAQANQTITLKSGSTELVSFIVPAEYTASTSGSGRPGGPGGSGNGSQILITCGGIVSGQSYTLQNGTSSSNVTARQYGSSSGRPW